MAPTQALDATLRAFEDDTSRVTGERFLDLVAAYMARAGEGKGAVSTPLSASAIAERFDEPMPAGGQPIDGVVGRLERDVLPDVNTLLHPMYMGHQVSAPLPAAIWAESFISALNQSVAVWEMSPVATVIEHRVIRWMCDLAGYGPAAGGTFTSGGTEATFTALLAARAFTVPDAWENGLGDRPPVVVCGEHAHYAVGRAAGELGLGMRRVITIPSIDRKMNVRALADRLGALRADGERVMAVVATAGSTATGSFDDLEAIGALCDEHGIWLHVDGAHGASALLSRAHRHRLRGIERARSIAWDPHKMMLLPLAAGMVLVRDERDLEAAFSQRAPYLFHGVEGERSWDQGRRSFLCSRRADALKLWVALQRYGAGGIAALFDDLCETTRALHDAIAADPRFEAIHEPECNILCFRYLGEGTEHLRAEHPQAGNARPILGHAERAHAPDPRGENRQGASERMDLLNAALRDRYNRSGRGWITTTVLEGRRVLRVTVMNPRTRPEHVRRMLDGLAAEGRALMV